MATLDCKLEFKLTYTRHSGATSQLYVYMIALLSVNVAICSKWIWELLSDQKRGGGIKNCEGYEMLPTCKITG